MESLQDSMVEFKTQLHKGVIQKAYLGLMEYMWGLKTHFRKKYPEYTLPGSIYYGFMDMTYFSIVTEPLKRRDLKIAVVFLYDEFRFEVWLSGKNKQVLMKYWEILTASGWDKYKVVKPGKGIDSILEKTAAVNPGFGDLDTLTTQIETETLAFISDVEGFLERYA